MGKTGDKQLSELPSKIKFCNRCVISNQRPRIIFDAEGVCGACRYADEKKKIDWNKREHMLRELCDKYRSKDGSYDVIVPCSGGKDSSSVAHKLKHKYGMHPLTVTWAPLDYTDIGFKNFRKFVASGFSNVCGWPNGKLNRKFSRLGFEHVGDPFLPFIYGQMAFAFHMALKLNVKLVFFGENGEAEYGGSLKDKDLFGRPVEEWAEAYFKGMTVDELVKYGLSTGQLTKDEFSESDLKFYRPPSVDDFKQSGIQMHWFGFYEKWVPQENFYYSVEHTGFEANPDGRSEGTYSKYASLDDQMDGLHYYLMLLKFGICRATSDSAHEVRDGHITREEAVALVKKYDGEFPTKYYKEFKKFIGMTDEEIWTVIEKFRSPHIWKVVDGNWRLRSAAYDESGDSSEEPVYLSSLPDNLRRLQREYATKVKNI
tara:strand:+ start:1446 stop:2729 length:1284 start_codon:yes stop_codon:yes gene_type:complete